MTTHTDFRAASPGAARTLGYLSSFAADVKLERRLLGLVRIRLSQLSGSACCIQQHTQEARTTGESDQRLCLLSSWRDTTCGCYTPRERVALAWAEALTHPSATSGAPDEAYGNARALFTEAELVGLTAVVVSANAHNRMALSFSAETNVFERCAPPSFDPGARCPLCGAPDDHGELP